MSVPAGSAGGLATCGRIRPAHGQLPAILLWMHNGLGYIYDSVGFNGLTAGPSRAMPQKDANMSIEQFIDNEVKSNDVVLFMKGTPQFPQCGFSGRWCRSSITSGSAIRV